MSPTQGEYKLKHCPVCNQMTNHLNGECQKHQPTHHDWEEEWDSKWTRPRSGECDNGCCKMWEGKRDFQSEGQKEFIKKLVDQVRAEERERVIEIIKNYADIQHNIDNLEDFETIQKFLEYMNDFYPH